MNKFNYCPIIEVGDVFTRIDRNRKVWKAEVINRTEYFVDVKKTQPYQIKVADEGLAGELGCYHYEDAEPTIERCMLHRRQEEIETDEVIKDIWGTRKKRIKVDTAEYYIECVEVYSRYPEYDKTYSLTKFDKPRESDEKGFETFYKYAEEN